MDAKIESLFYDNGIAFNVAASSCFALTIWEHKIRENACSLLSHFCVLVRARLVCSLSHPHKIRTNLGSETTQRNVAMFTRIAKWQRQSATPVIFRILLGIMKVCSLRCQFLPCPAIRARRPRPDPMVGRTPSELPNRRIVESLRRAFCRIAESRSASARFGAIRSTLPKAHRCSLVLAHRYTCS